MINRFVLVRRAPPVRGLAKFRKLPMLGSRLRSFARNLARGAGRRVVSISPAFGAEEKHCLETARRNLTDYFRRHEPKRADAGDRWEHFLQGVRDIVPTFSTASEAIHFGQHNDAGFDHRLPAHLWAPLLPLTFDL